MRTVQCIIPASCVLLLTVSAVCAQTDGKNGFSLFNPVPDDQLRPMNSQVYDNVMDARTLNAGHVQVEGGFFNGYFNSSTPAGYDPREFEWEPRITVGLLDNVDCFIRPSFTVTSHSSGGNSDDFGRITTGARINLWGNDSGTTALAVRPYLSLPVQNGGDVLGGGDAAFLLRLSEGFFIKADTEIYATENSHHTLYTGFDNELSLNKNLCSKAVGYCYLNTTATSDPYQTWYGYSGFGVLFNAGSNLQLFAGIGFGFTPQWTYGQTRAYDYNPRCGIVWRF